MGLRYLHVSVALFPLALLLALLMKASFTPTQAQTQRAGSAINIARVLPQRVGGTIAATFPATMREDFENTWPAPGWSLQGFGGSGEYLFGQRDCRPQNGAFAGWSVGGGADGTNLPCDGQYPNNVQSVAEYGPFDLSTAVSSMLTFAYRGASEPEYDFLFFGASIDGINYCGYTIDGNHDSGYTQDSFDLNDIRCPGFPPSFLGNPNVTIAFYFSSDNSIADVGFTIDDIALTTIDTPTVTPTDTPTATPTDTPTTTPTATPTDTPTATPTDTPTTTPPTATPTDTPTTTPTGTPPPVYLPITILDVPPPTPTPSPPPPPACSDIEGNNYPEDSRQLIPINTSCIASFQDQLNDRIPPDDYYWIQPTIGQHISVDLAGIPPGANYDIALVLQDNQGKYARVVWSDNPGRDDESFTYIVTSNQRHYIRVRAITRSISAENTYILTVTVN